MRRPNFFLIGAPKCGTTALASYLDAHPQVAVVAGKEPWFWSSDVVNPGPPHLTIRSRDEYLALFQSLKPSARVLVDASTSYWFSERAVAEILEFEPEARFAVILRRPRDLVHSLYWEQRMSMAERSAHFLDAWRAARGRRPRHPCGRWSYCDYAWIASHATHLERLLELVPAARRTVLVFEEFVTNPRAAYQALLALGGADDDGRTAFPLANGAKISSSRLVSWMVHELPRHAPPLFGAARQISASVGFRDVRGALMRRFTTRLEKPELEPGLAREIDDFFAPEVERFERLLDRRIPAWHA
jgi:hypothetical protein